MASLFATGLTGGNAVNNINIVLWSIGVAHLRHTDRADGVNAARALISRRTGVDVPTKTNPYTLKTT